MYYIIKNDLSFEKVIHAEVPLEWNSVSMMSGKSLKKKLPPVTFFINFENKIPNFIPNMWGYLIFDQKSKDMISSFCSIKEIEFLPCILNDDNKKILYQDYFMANLLCTIETIDLEKSTIEYTEKGDVFSAENIVLVPKMKHANLFRMKEYMSLICCSKGLVDAYKNNSLTGIIFKPLLEYSI